jgi:hypothetical protein
VFVANVYEWDVADTEEKGAVFLMFSWPIWVAFQSIRLCAIVPLMVAERGDRIAERRRESERARREVGPFFLRGRAARRPASLAGTRHTAPRLS